EKLKQTGQRFVATGLLFFPPNISMVYHLRDFRLTGPLLPKSIAKLHAIRQTHEGSDSTNIYLSSVNDAASVSYVLTRWPKYSALDRELPFKPFPSLSLPCTLIAENANLIMDSASYCLSKNGELFAKFRWQTGAKHLVPYAAELDIVDKNGNELAKGQRLQILPAKGDFTEQSMSVKMPRFQSLSQDVYAVLRIFSCFNEGMLPLQKNTLPMRALGVDLLKINPATSEQVDLSDARLQLIFEDGDQVLIFKNKGAMPEAYLAKAIVPVKSSAEAAKIMEDSHFDPGKTTIIESPGAIAVAKSAAGNRQYTPPRVTRRDPNTVLVEYDSSEDAFLILTDTFYSGWHAYLDGEEQPIYRANLAFRAVKVPPGKHELKFVFLPASFYGGGIIAILTALGVLLASLKRKKK
ncbi:MAG: YfhO family protein, partial [Candidatus Melainabacteria bacterium]|nr:YfhO family protein [Candidatus Melainabacteria bacterium]